MRIPVLRQCARRTAFQLCGELRVGLAVCGKFAVPFGLGLAAAFACIPARVHGFRNFKRRVIPADGRPRGRDFFRAQRCAVRATGAGFFRRTFADDGFAANENRLLGFSLGLLYCSVNGCGVMTVHTGDYAPTIRLKALGHIFGEPLLDPALLRIDGDAVVVVDGDELVDA